jgi:hypothetical protein
MHPNLYTLLHALGKEASQVIVNCHLVAQRKLDRRQMRSTTDRDRTLQQLWNQYDEKEITTVAFLRECVRLTENI